MAQNLSLQFSSYIHHIININASIFNRSRRLYVKAEWEGCKKKKAITL